MAIDFTIERWDAAKEDYRQWWCGELKRPLLHLYGPGRDPGRAAPVLSPNGFIPNYGTAAAADIIDAWDYGLSCRTYLADAVPAVWPNCGPGVLATFIGGELEAAPDTVWFHPQSGMPDTAEGLALDAFDDISFWYRRLADIMRAGIERWQGMVQIGMTDLGGNLDVVSTFRPSEKLLFDLYDCPAEVKRLNWEAHESWWQAFNAFNGILQPVNPGYSAWAGFYCEQPQYMLQCDFCYMIGPDMFDEFVKPELAASCRRLTHSFYHLDGPGQLPHLDSLLAIDELDGVQWVPGDGSPNQKHWPELYRKIRKAGKLIQLFGGLDTLDAVATQLGSAEGIIVVGGSATQAEIDDFRRKWG